jgi:processive 1,2-diacylglycerol beta-glucosyltransferase
MGAIKYRNILIISASIGSGHTQAANAVRDELLRCSPASKVTVVDFMDGSSSFGSLIKETYLKMIDVFPNAYDLLYRWSQGPFHGSNVKNLTALVMKTRMLRLLREYRPDLVIFTHPFPCCAAAYLRRTRRIAVPLIAVMTDFASHQLWIHREIDLYFVANPEIKKALCDRGIADTAVYVTGIPISPKFAKTPLNDSNRNSREPVVLIMGGGLGLGSVEKVMLHLAASKYPLRIVVVAGKNSRLRQKLIAAKKRSPHPVTIIGYTDRVNELMANASILITKPGALTCSEALAMQLPLLLYNPIPGQEEDNANYLTRQGVAVRITADDQFTQAVDRLITTPEVLNEMQLKARNASRPNAAADIAAILLTRLPARQTVSPAS